MRDSIWHRVERAVRRTKLLPLLPAVLLVVVFFVVPMFQLFQMSFFERDRAMLYRPAFTVENFARFFSSPHHWQMLTNSLYLSTIVTLLTLILGYPAAYFLCLASKLEKRILAAGYLSSLFVTVLVSGLGWFVMFMPFGVLQRLLSSLGLIEGRLMFSQTMPALIIALTQLHLPFALFVLVPSIQRVPRDKIRAAQTMGAPTWRIFTSIIIPLTMPGIVSAAILVFSLVISSYLIPVILTGESVRLLPLGIWSYTSELLNWPYAAAIAVVLFVTTVTCIYLLIAITNKLTKRGQWEMI